ncbi:VCBS repeat-containing protein [Streptomyces subrutilus]|uniref:FG-GAP repeat domain-containing protein n=1 Tax=Streptomyces subrutilus TaxID=36818 RepID=UPI002E1518C7|nr:VCBS repeat-containing protein [Streptomyces subrutilus]
MKPVRTLPAAALALALGLSAVAPAAAASGPAAPKVTAPRSSPAPGFAGEDLRSDCYTDPYSGNGAGWIGGGDLTLRATTGATPDGPDLRTTFQLWDTSYGGPRTDHPTSWSKSPEAETVIPRDRLADGGRYAWRARATNGKLTGPYTSWCHFRVDSTPPTAEVTTDASPKKAGEEASFTLSGTDTGSEIACARWRTTSVPSVGWRCSDEATDAHVVRLADGSADIKVTPAAWGTQSVFLQTMDNAGNVSQDARLDYYAQPASAPAAFGDIDADGRPDVLVPDAAGHLRVPGRDPRSTPNAHAGAAPGGAGSWADVQYSHRGTFRGGAVDDLVAHAPGGRSLYLFPNDGAGLFTGQAPVALRKPGTCLDRAGATLDCAAHGFGGDWSAVTGIVAFGSPRGDTAVDGALPLTSLLFVEQGRLWLVGGGWSGLNTRATLVSADADRWSDHDLLTPGRAQGTDFPTLWARSRADGTVRAFTVAGTPQAPDFSAFADPSAGPALATLPPAAHPRLGSDGDLTGDGLPDLWSADAAGAVTVLPGTGTAGPYPAVTGFGPAV